MDSARRGRFAAQPETLETAPAGVFALKPQVGLAVHSAGIFVDASDAIAICLAAIPPNDRLG